MTRSGAHTLSRDHGSTALLAADPGWSDAQRADMLTRDRADLMSVALRQYGSHRQAALMAERHGDSGSAERSRAMARVALHGHPELLALVESAAQRSVIAAG